MTAYNDFPGCLFPTHKFGQKGWACENIQQPLYKFFRGPYEHLLRYSHHDYVEWDGSDCEKLKTEIRNVVRKREAGYPFSATEETLWFPLPRGTDGKIDWRSEKCNLEANLGKIISGETQREISFQTEHRSDIASATWSLTYRNTSPLTFLTPGKSFGYRNPNVVVDIRIKSPKV